MGNKPSLDNFETPTPSSLRVHPKRRPPLTNVSSPVGAEQLPLKELPEHGAGLEDAAVSVNGSISSLLDRLDTVNDMIWFENYCSSGSSTQPNATTSNNSSSVGNCCSKRKSKTAQKDLTTIEEMLTVLIKSCIDISIKEESRQRGKPSATIRTRLNGKFDYDGKVEEVVEVVKRGLGRAKANTDIEFRHIFGLFDSCKQTGNTNSKLTPDMLLYRSILDSLVGFLSKRCDARGRWIISGRKRLSINLLKSEDGVLNQELTINVKVALANKLLEFVESFGDLKETIEREIQCRESERNNREVINVKSLRENFVEVIPSWKFWNSFRGRNVSFLLFEEERERMKAILDMEEDPRNHWGSIARRLSYVSKEEESATFHAVKVADLLPISLKAMEYYEKDNCQKSSDKKRPCLSSFSLMLMYLYGIEADIEAAKDHYNDGRNTFAILTFCFIFTPILAEAMSKLLLMIFGWRKKFGMKSWKEIFPSECFLVLPRMWCKMEYLIKSKKNYEGLANAYYELHRHRCIKGQVNFKSDIWNDCSCLLNLCCALASFEEILYNQSTLTESMIEDAPQLFVQMTALVTGVGGWEQWRSAFLSLVAISHTMHTAHKTIHRRSVQEIWTDDFSKYSTCLETAGNFLVYGARLASMSIMLAVIPRWFFIGAILYLVLLYCILTFVSKRSKHYRKLHGFKTTIFWPINRLFCIPFTVGIWRLDSIDHFLFYLETVFMGAFVPYIFTNEYLTQWTAIYLVIICVLLSLVILLVFKMFFHPSNDLCKIIDNMEYAEVSNNAFTALI